MQTLVNQTDVQLFEIRTFVAARPRWCLQQFVACSPTIWAIFCRSLQTFLLLHGTVQTVSTVPVWKSLSDELRNSDNFEALNDSWKFFLAVTSVTSTLEVISYLLTYGHIEIHLRTERSWAVAEAGSVDADVQILMRTCCWSRRLRCRCSRQRQTMNSHQRRRAPHATSQWCQRMNKSPTPCGCRWTRRLSVGY